MLQKALFDCDARVAASALTPLNTGGQPHTGTQYTTTAVNPGKPNTHTETECVEQTEYP